MNEMIKMLVHFSYIKFPRSLSVIQLLVSNNLSDLKYFRFIYTDFLTFLYNIRTFNYPCWVGVFMVRVILPELKKIEPNL